MKQLLFLLFFGCSTVCCFSACSGATTPKPIKEVAVPGDQLTVDIFSARGSFGKSEYERYRLEGDVLWRECGTIAKKSEDIPEEGKIAVSQLGKVWLVMKAKDAQLLSKEALETLHTRVRLLLNAVHSEEEAPKLPRPAAYDHFSGAGLFELIVSHGKEQTIVLTSLDAVADSTPRPLEQVHDLFARLRGVDSPSCTNSNFYGVGKKGDATL